jgi:predicted nuclease of predicted toxin-antitoxin system
VKLLFDQNISFRVVNRILNSFPEARHVSELGLQKAFDKQIWDYSRDNRYSIVTFDADFYDLVTLLGHPPKIIWLRLGNTSTINLATILISHSEIINSFLSDPAYQEIACLEID